MNTDLIARLLATANLEANELADLLNEAADALEANRQIVNDPFERVPQHAHDPGYGPVPPTREAVCPHGAHPRFAALCKLCNSPAEPEAKQRPMTDNELWDLWQIPGSSHIDFARAIEAHHGIKL